MVGRPENQLDPATGELPAFAWQLRNARIRAGKPTYETMQKSANYSISALSNAAGGKKMPTWPCVQAYLTACQVTDPEELEQWKQRWEETAAAVKAPKREKDSITTVVVNTITAALPVLNHRYSDSGPLGVSNFEEFQVAMDQIRVEAGLTVRQLVARSKLAVMPSPGSRPRGLSQQEVYALLRGTEPPPPRTVGIYLVLCGLRTDQINLWLERLRVIALERRRAAAALKAISGAQPIITARAVLKEPPPDDEEIITFSEISERLSEDTTDVNGPVHVGQHRRPGRWRSVLQRWLR